MVRGAPLGTTSGFAFLASFRGRRWRRRSDIGAVVVRCWQLHRCQEGCVARPLALVWALSAFRLVRLFGVIGCE